MGRLWPRVSPIPNHLLFRLLVRFGNKQGGSCALGAFGRAARRCCAGGAPGAAPQGAGRARSALATVPRRAIARPPSIFFRSFPCACAKKPTCRTRPAPPVGLPFAWRKKWEKVRDEVRYCSDRCRSARGGASAGASTSPTASHSVDTSASHGAARSARPASTTKKSPR